MDMDLGLALRPATIDDMELLFSWANDMDVRRNSFHQETIRYDTHVKWMTEKLYGGRCQIFIGLWGTRPVGQVRFDIDQEGTAEIDYSVDADIRGRGIATLMLSLAMEECDVRIREFVAKVKPENRASVRVFEKCGFDRRQAPSGDGNGERPYIEFHKKREGDRREIPAVAICTHKSWNIKNAREFQRQSQGRYRVEILTEKEQLTAENLAAFQPEYVFFPHWSYIIPESVYSAYTCVVFHMTDLPFGRGGSPLQNLIVRGFTHTKISAIHVDRGLDTGDIYTKEDLGLEGTADEILRRASDVIFRKMIPYILRSHPRPVPQQGEPTVFRRRKPEEGQLAPDMEELKLYDMIRMLDGEGYPPAFVDFGDYRIEFSNARLEDGCLEARAVFVRKDKR